MSFLTSAVLADTTPDSEDFEHNDLTGIYGGDTGQFNIQTGTVDEGIYALQGSGGSDALIVRKNTEKFNRYGLKMTWSEYHDSAVSNSVIGPAVSTSVTGYSSTSGYQFYHDSGADFQRIERYDNGTENTLKASSKSHPEDQWISGEVKFLSDDTIEYVVNGNKISAVDPTYTDVLLAFNTYDTAYIDGLQFSTI